MVGRIVALTCGKYSIDINGEIFQAPARGIFRKKGDKPVVGDIVEFNVKDQIIEEVFPRTSLLKRPKIANIDQLVIVESLVEPEFSYLLTFKYLTYANMNNLNGVLVLTKSDKFNNQEKIDEIKEVFNKLNIDVYVISNKTQEGIETIKSIFQGHVSAFIGQTGVGKSSLINAIDPNYARLIGEYSKALGRGKHQTKEVILLSYQNGLIADTPGFSSLELDLYKEDLAFYFPGFLDLTNECFFSNCLHLSENKCQVKQELNNGNIPQIAYECYQKLSSEAIYKSRRFD